MASKTEPAKTEDEPSESVEIAFPLELSVEGVPLSLQASPDSKREWKAVVANKARSSLQEGAWLTEAPVSVTIFYFPDGPMIGDVDNIVKPILDSLNTVVYMDDQLVERVWVEKFEPEGVVTFSQPTAALARALDTDRPVVYVRIDDRQSLEKSDD